MSDNHRPPALDQPGWRQVADAFHAYACVLGALRAALSPRQKHGWHATLVPNARGLTTTPIHGPGQAIEARLDLLDGHVALIGSDGDAERWYLSGMPARRLAELVDARVADWGMNPALSPADFDDVTLGAGSQRASRDLFGALRWSDALLKALKSCQGHETSPVQLWPQPFDLALLWLSGGRVTDPAAPKRAHEHEADDEQMHFGFSVGAGTERPFYYVTCYPAGGRFPRVELPPWARAAAAGLTGVRVDYDALRNLADPFGSLLELFELLRSDGAAMMTF